MYVLQETLSTSRATGKINKLDPKRKNIVAFVWKNQSFTTKAKSFRQEDYDQEISNFGAWKCIISFNKTKKDSLKLLGWDVLPRPSRRWGSRLHSSTSTISSMLENDSMNSWPPKISGFSGMVFINYLKCGQNM